METSLFFAIERKFLPEKGTAADQGLKAPCPSRLHKNGDDVHSAWSTVVEDTDIQSNDG
jgi:hypothetical protein